MTAGALDYRALSELSPRRRTEVESELISIHAAAPEILDVPAIFTVAVIDALSNILDVSTAKALQVYLGNTNLGDPDAVFSSLDAILDQGAHIVKGAIVKEFESKVHSLYVEVMRRMKEAMAIDSPHFTNLSAETDPEATSQNQSPVSGHHLLGAKSMEPPGHDIAEDQDVVIRFVQAAIKPRKQ